MNLFPPPLSILINELEKLPGIGPKTAQRLCFFLLKQETKDTESLGKAILSAKEKIKLCKRCFNFTEETECSICKNEMRKQNILCVVEQAFDIVAIEKTGVYKGLYHVLHGCLSPLNGVTPASLKISELLSRLKEENIDEVIVATNPTVEGEATAIYLAHVIKPAGIKITRIAHGVPMGSDLEYADEVTLSRALNGRREM